MTISKRAFSVLILSLCVALLSACDNTPVKIAKGPPPTTEAGKTDPGTDPAKSDPGIDPLADPTLPVVPTDKGGDSRANLDPATIKGLGKTKAAFEGPTL